MSSPTSPTSSSFGNTYVPQFFSYELDEKSAKSEMTRRDSQLAISLNLKENGVVETVETQNGQQFYGSATNIQKKRYVFRKAFTIGAIPKNTGISLPHGISGITIVTHVFGGVVTDQPDFRPLPHASVTANANIEVIITATDYKINNGNGGPNITSGILVIEYLKQ